MAARVKDNLEQCRRGEYASADLSCFGGEAVGGGGG